MDEISRYAVGLDIGTSTVRAVVASVMKDGRLNVIGSAEVPNSGMRRGTVVNLAGPAQAIDKVLGEVERMGGYEINAATVSINGSQILSTRTEGKIAAATANHEINQEDLTRLTNVALDGEIPANQEILDVVPLQYVLDGQAGIKDPLGMVALKIEMQANVVSTLVTSYDNLRKASEAANVTPMQVVPSAVAAARAVLSERQMENGVAVVDIGASTTGVAIYEESDLQYVGVVPVGSNNITNDLAVMLAIDTEVAEEIKRRFATGSFGESEEPVVIRWRGKELHFERDQIDEVVQARLDEILELVHKELKRARYEQRLPEGVVLTGGGARMRDIDKFVRLTLGMSVKIGAPSGLTGLVEKIQKPEFSAAVGLMLSSAENEGRVAMPKKGRKKAGAGSGFGVGSGKGSGEKKPGMLKRFFGKF